MLFPLQFGRFLFPFLPQCPTLFLYMSWFGGHQAPLHGPHAVPIAQPNLTIRELGSHHQETYMHTRLHPGDCPEAVPEMRFSNQAKGTEGKPGQCVWEVLSGG